MPELVARNRELPYGGPGTKLMVPMEIWHLSLEVLSAYGDRRSEGLVLWGGVVNAAGAYVTGLYIPRHDPQGARAALNPEESRWLLRRLRSRDEKLLAQVHSHPGAAYHSYGDDEGATSFHPGFFSIVVPNFAKRVRDIKECAVFEFLGASFSQLDDRTVQERVRLSPLVEDRIRPAIVEAQKSWLHTIGSKLKQKLTGWRRR